MTKTVVVPLDDNDLAARALPVAEALAGAAYADVETISVPPSASVADAIVDDAVGFPEPVIVMATHGRSAFGELVLGSVTDDVIRRSPVPVVVVGPHADAAPLAGDGPVLVAVDRPAGDRAVLDAAAGFARTLDAPVVVVHDVVPVPAVDGAHDVDVEVELAAHASEQLPSGRRRARVHPPTRDQRLAVPGAAARRRRRKRSGCARSTGSWSSHARVDDIATARSMADIIEHHAHESTGGLTYSEMGRFMTPDGDPAGTNVESEAVVGDNGQPVANPLRNVAFQAATLRTSLFSSIMAFEVSTLVIGIGALLVALGVSAGGVGVALAGLALPGLAARFHNEPVAAA